MAAETRPALMQLNLVVADVSASVAFYRRLGLEIDTSHPYAAHHVEAKMPNGIALDLDSIEFARKWDAGWRGQTGGGRNVIGFALPTRAAVDERYAALTGAGYTGQQPPYDAFWGARYAIVEDPDGNPVGLMSPRDPTRRTTPPSM